MVILEERQPLSGNERRRYDRINRRLGVTFTLDGREVPAYTVDVSRSGALFEADIIPSTGTQLLLNLSDRKNPELSLYLKARVVRELSTGTGATQFAVEFGDAIAREPKRLRMFLDKALGIESGLIRVVGDEEGQGKAYAFSFEAIHREGEERIKALQSSLFSSLDEMEEADAILANFGDTGELPEGLQNSVDIAPTQPPEPVTPPEPAPGRKVTRKELAAQKKAQAAQKKEAQAALAREAAAKAEAQQAEAKAKAKAEKEARPSLFKRLFGGGTKGNKGDTLIQTQRIPNVVANDIELPVVYRIGNSRFQGQATRLYCAGIKVVTSQELPKLYAPIQVVIPLAGARKISQIELTGDVTRVRSDGAGDDENSGGLFEMRLSMRTDKVHLELYRVLLEQLTGESTSPEAL